MRFGFVKSLYVAVLISIRHSFAIIWISHYRLSIMCHTTGRKRNDGHFCTKENLLIIHTLRMLILDSPTTSSSLVFGDSRIQRP